MTQPQTVTVVRDDRERIPEHRVEWHQHESFHAEFVTAEPRQMKEVVSFRTVRVLPDDEAERWLSLSMEALEGEW